MSAEGPMSGRDQSPGYFYRASAPGRFESSLATAGPWDPNFQHAGPPSALLGRSCAEAGASVGQRLSRLSVDILHPIPVGPVEVAVEQLRGGRRVSYWEAVLATGGRPVARARAWSTAPADPPTPVRGPSSPPPPRGPTAPVDWPGANPSGYLQAVDWAFVEGSFSAPGPARVWGRPRPDLVSGEETTALSRVLILADSGSGASSVLGLDRWRFLSLDYHCTFERDPRGEWFLLDSQTHTGEAGIGSCRTVIYDQSGRVGTANQTLLVAPA